MPFQEVDNPKGAFGYAGALTTGTALGLPASPGQGMEIHECRNMSTTIPIRAGSAVLFSTLTTNGVGVVTGTVGTTLGDYRFYGVAITTAGRNTDNTTLTSLNPGIGNDFCQVVVRGVVPAFIADAVEPGDMLWFTTSTGTTATGSTNGGTLGVAATTYIATGTYGIAGVALTSGTTGSTGYLETGAFKGLVMLRPSFVGPISTA